MGSCHQWQAREFTILLLIFTACFHVSSWSVSSKRVIFPVFSVHVHSTIVSSLLDIHIFWSFSKISVDTSPPPPRPQVFYYIFGQHFVCSNCSYTSNGYNVTDCFNKCSKKKLVADSEFWIRSNNDKFCEWWFQGNGRQVKSCKVSEKGTWGNLKLFTSSSDCHVSVVPDYSNCKAVHF